MAGPASDRLFVASPGLRLENRRRRACRGSLTPGTPASPARTAERPARPRGSGDCGWRAARTGPRGCRRQAAFPWSKGTRASSRECMTSVGTDTWVSSALTSVSPVAIRLRTASSGEVEIRWSSLNQSICSLVPPGINCEVNSWRKAGFSWPQPRRTRVSIAAPCSLSACFAQPTAYPPNRIIWVTRSGWRTA